jgi:hypothetical protein
MQSPEARAGMEDRKMDHAANNAPRGQWILGILATVGVLVAGGLGLLLLGKGDSASGEQLPQIGAAFLLLVAIGGVVECLAHWRAAIMAVASHWPRRWRLSGTGWIFKLVALLGSVLLLSFWFQDIAFSHDHAEHFSKAFHFWHEMLGRGRLKGWSHFLAFGYPSGEMTPFGPELWVALFRAATFGLLSWTRTYALAFAGVVVFAVAAVYLFGQRFFGRSVAVIAAIVWMLDPGGWYQGGWFWLEWLGVWPVTLAMSFTLLALINLADLLASDSGQSYRWGILRAGLWMLASLVTHQLPIVVYGIALPCLLIAEWLKNKELSYAQAVRLAAAVGLGLGLAAFYLVPMFVRNGLTQDLGVRGFTLVDLAHRLVEMRLFENGWSPIVVLGLLGGVLAIRRRPSSGWFFVLCAAVFVLLSSDILVSVFHAERLWESIVKIECQRMLLVAKLFWFPLAAYAVVSLFRGESAETKPAARSPLRRLSAIALMATLGAPLVTPVAVHVYRTQVKKDIEHRGATSLAQDFQKFFEWSHRERQTNDEPYRIAYSLLDKHDHIVSISPVFNETFFYKVGYTSAQQFRSFPMSDEPDLLEALAVKYMVADHDYTDGAFVLEQTMGQLRVYRFSRYRARHPFTLTGSGQAELVKLEPERIHLRLQGTSPDTRLKLHVAGFPRWEAKLNGRAVPIAPATVYGMEYPILMEVPVADGDLVFRYVRRTPEWLGLSITLATLLVLVFVGTGRVKLIRSRAWFSAAHSFAMKVARVLPWGAGCAVVCSGLFIIWRVFSPVPRSSSDHLLESLAPTDEVSLAGARCERRGPIRWQCGPHEVRVDVVGGAYGSHVCLTAPAAGPLVIAARKQLGSFLEATYDPSANMPGRIRVAVDGSMLGDTATRGDEHGLSFLQIDTRLRAGMPANLRVELEGAPLHCFDLRIVR